MVLPDKGIKHRSWKVWPWHHADNQWSTIKSTWTRVSKGLTLRSLTQQLHHGRRTLHSHRKKDTCQNLLQNYKKPEVNQSNNKGFQDLVHPYTVPPHSLFSLHTHTRDTAIRELFNPPFLSLYFILSIFHVSNYKSTSGERCWSSHCCIIPY